MFSFKVSPACCMLLWTRVYTSKVSSTVKVDFSMSADVQSVCLSRLVWLIYDRHRYSYHCSHPNPAHPYPHPYTLTGLNWTLLTIPLLLMIYWGGGLGCGITFGFVENADSPVKPLPQESDFFLSVIRHCHDNIFPNAGDTQTT